MRVTLKSDLKQVKGMDSESQKLKEKKCKGLEAGCVFLDKEVKRRLSWHQVGVSECCCH